MVANAVRFNNFLKILIYKQFKEGAVLGFTAGASHLPLKTRMGLELPQRQAFLGFVQNY